MEPIKWPDRIRHLESLGWSLSELARAIELSPQALSDIKTGRTTEPRGMAAVRLHSMHSQQIRPAKDAA